MRGGGIDAAKPVLPSRRRKIVALATAIVASIGPLSGLSAQTSVRGIAAERPDRNQVPHTLRGSAPAIPRAHNPAVEIAPFRLTSVTVTGSTLDAATLAAAWRPFGGTMIDGKGLTAITNAVAAAYAKSDIALYTVMVPEQHFGDGVLRLAAVEGRVAGVEIRGKLRRNRLRLLQAYLRRLERERPLHTSTLQRVVSLIRDMPGLTPDLSFTQTSTPGDVTLVITATEKPIQAAFGINDRGTALLGRAQAQADLYLNGLFAGADQFHATVVAPTHVDRFQYYAGAYTLPLDADGTTMTANASYLRTRPKAFPLKGDAKSVGVQFSHPIVRTYKHTLYATLGLDGIDSNNALLGYALSNDRVRTLRTALSYTATGKRNLLTVSLTGSFGLSILGARVVPGLANGDFRKLTAKITDNVQIGKQFVLRLDLFGQATGDDLPASEQVALGGDEFGRAYESALIVGDRGYAGSAEFAWGPDAGAPKALKGSELYLFSDGGKVRSRARLGIPASDNHLASVGAGVRLQALAKVIVQLEAVRGLANPVAYEDRERTRLLFSVRSAF